MKFPRANPLELPEIRRTISRLVTLKDAVACARVCKSWTNDFVAVIWHTIDFSVHTNLAEMDARILMKHGHHVRVVKNMGKSTHIATLTISNVSQLREITTTMTASQLFYGFYGILLQRNSATIQSVEVTQPPSEDAVPYFPINTLCPFTKTGATSKLSRLKMDGLIMPREAFSILLQGCPSLDKLNVQDTTFLSWPIYGKSSDNCFKHLGLQRLEASVGQVCRPDNNMDAPSLLAHFPNLSTWHTWNTGTTSPVPIKELRDEVDKLCPLLKEVSMEGSPPETTEMIVHAFDGLTYICVLDESLSTEVIMAILRHQHTLVYFQTFTEDNDTYDSDVISDIEEDLLGTPGWVTQSIPRHCAQLQILDLPHREMDMGDIEEASWGCSNLEELRVRIKDLNTKQMIDRAFRLWTEARVVKKTQIDYGTVIPQSDNSIEARVARHLLKFDKLKSVWLGGKIRNVA